MNKKDERIHKVFKKHKGFARTKDILAAGIHTRNMNIIGTDTYFHEVKIIRRAVSFGEHEF